MFFNVHNQNVQNELGRVSLDSALPEHLLVRSQEIIPSWMGYYGVNAVPLARFSGFFERPKKLSLSHYCNQSGLDR